MVKKNLIYSIINTSIISGGGVLTYSLLSKNLSSSEFGLYSLIISIISFIILVGCFGSNLISSKLYNNNNDIHLSRLVKVLIPSTIFSLTIFTIIFYSSDFSQLNDKISFTILFLIILISIFLRSISDFFRSKNQLFKFFNYNSISSGAGISFWISYLTFLIILIANNMLTLKNIFLIILLSSIIVTCIFLIENFKKICTNFPTIISSLFKNDLNFKVFVSASFGIFLVSIFKSFKEQFSIWTLGYFSTVDQVALFFIAYKSIFFLHVPLMIIDIAIPQILAKNNISQILYERKIRMISTIRFYTALFSITILFMFSAETINFFFGSTYIIVDESFRFLLLSLVPYCALGPCHAMMFLTKYDIDSLKIDVILLIPTIILSIYLISKFNYEGAVFAYGFFLFFSQILYFLFIKRNMKINTLPYISPIKALNIVKKEL